MNYGLLNSKNDTFIILREDILRENIGGSEIEEATLSDNVLSLHFNENLLEIPIINEEDRALLLQSDCFISIINIEGNPVKLLEINQRK